MDASYKYDYYAVLGVPPTASQEEIRKAYLRLSKIHHPDRGGSTEMMQLINNAYGVLRNPTEKENYDAWHCNAFKRTYSTPESEEIYVTLHILSYENGYYTRCVSLSSCPNNASDNLYDNNLYGYVSAAHDDKIVIMSKESFYNMKNSYDSDRILLRIVAEDTVYRSVILVDKNKIINNYRKFLNPHSNTIFAKKISDRYMAISEDLYNTLCSEIEKKEKKGILHYFFASVGALIVLVKALIVILILFAIFSDTNPK